MNEQRQQLQSLHQIDLNVGDVGTTVRNGTKWAGQTKAGECLDLVVQEKLNDKGNVVGVARVVALKVAIFRKIKAKDIDNEHEISSRTYSGLLASMKKAYGQEFSEDSVVTVLSYRRIA